MTKADHSPKTPTKLETITLKVFIHCEGCRRKVKRIVRVLDGVESVTVESATGKVTITGTALDSKAALQRLQKYGKHAEMWPSPNSAAAAGKAAGGNNQPGQTKPGNNAKDTGDNATPKKKSSESNEKPAPAGGAGNESKKGGGKKDEAAGAAKGEAVAAGINSNTPEKSTTEAATTGTSDTTAPAPQNGTGGGNGKKGGKKGGNGGGNNGGVVEVPIHDPPAPNVPTSMPATAVSANKSLAPYDSVQTEYYHSAEYATHMFSDENANNCSIM